MINIDEFMLTPQEILLNIAKNEKRKRKIKGFTQKKLAEMLEYLLAPSGDLSRPEISLLYIC